VTLTAGAGASATGVGVPAGGATGFSGAVERGSGSATTRSVGRLVNMDEEFHDPS
jgi:hypothetical protein